MKDEDEKYREIVKLLRKSEPKMVSSRELEESIMRRIQNENRRPAIAEQIFDFFFSWIYISWIRRSLITVSVVLVMIFIYQQGLIIGRINYLTDHESFSAIPTMTSASDNLDMKLFALGLGNRFRSRSITVPKERMDALLDSVNKLQEKYKDLIYLIENDPELRKVINEKTTGKTIKKLKL